MKTKTREVEAAEAGVKAPAKWCGHCRSWYLTYEWSWQHGCCDYCATEADGMYSCEEAEVEDDD